MPNNCVILPTLSDPQEAAFEYINKGFPVIPLCWPSASHSCGCGRNHDIKSVGKVPLTEHGLKDATQTKLGIQQYWNRWPRANIGIVITPGYFVLDVDIEHGGFESLETLQDRVGILPETLRVTTGSGGLHLWYQTNVPVHNKVTLGGLPGLDVRGEGGYVVAPPSLHRSGNPYSVSEDLPIVRAPEGLVSLCIRGHISQREPLAEDVILEGCRNQTLTSLAGGMRRKGMSQSAIEAALQVENRERCQPALPEAEIIKIAKSVATYLPVSSNGLLIKNNIQAGGGAPLQNSFASGQVSGQVVDKLGPGERGYGDLSGLFDQYLSENPEPHYKREVAEITGTTYKDPAFIKLVQRRKHDGQIRIISGGDKIQWINKDWQQSIIQLDEVAASFTDLALPFGAEKYIAVPEHSQIVTAGDIGSGKTHWGYLLAELNVGKIPIRHFFNEIGASKAKRNLEDFPGLLQHYGQDYFLIDLDKDSLDVAENLDPNGLNIYDYMHLTSSKEWFLVLQQELTKLSQRLEKGVICVMLQKKQGSKQAMGGDVTRMQCEAYLTLNIEHNRDGYKECRVDVEKAKDWVTNTNPETLCCGYKTSPKYGKLVKVGDWGRKPQE